MDIYTVAFGGTYPWMAERLRRSVTRNIPSAQIEIEHSETPEPKKFLPKFMTDNLLKLHLWCERVARRDFERLVLIDCDCLVLRSLDEAFRADFDIAYTTRPGSIPFNSGVIFVKNTPAAEAIMRRWYNHNARIVKNAGISLAGLRQWAGGNQWAFHQLLEDVKTKFAKWRIHPLPCRLWNCEQITQPDFDPERTAILHVKGPIRDQLVHHKPIADPVRDRLKTVVEVCRAYGY